MEAWPLDDPLRLCFGHKTNLISLPRDLQTAFCADPSLLPVGAPSAEPMPVLIR